MPIHRLTSTDAFVVVDLPGTSSATGIVRCARKILTDGAELLARSVTYSAASFDAQISGASGGINAEGDARGAAIAAFAAEAPTLIPGLRLELTAGKASTPTSSLRRGHRSRMLQGRTAAVAAPPDVMT